MSYTILYFTGTGNSLAVARRLAAKLPRAIVVSVCELLKQARPVIETDACGFVFPVYCQNVPEIVRGLIRRLEFPAEAYLFAIATHNGDPGYSHFTIDRILRKKGRRLANGFAVRMPGNSINPYNMNSDEEKRRRIEESESRCDDIVAAIKKRDPLPYAGSASFRKKLKGLRNLLRYKLVFNVSKSFWATDACDFCGLCARICPENNISVRTSLPAWGGHCQICFACIHWCPRHAIQNGPETASRRRYHHPDILIQDMVLRDDPGDFA